MSEKKFHVCCRDYVRDITGTAYYRCDTLEEVRAHILGEIEDEYKYLEGENLDKTKEKLSYQYRVFYGHEIEIKYTEPVVELLKLTVPAGCQIEEKEV